MATIYYRMVKEDMRTIDQIPEKYREAVQALLDAEG